MKKEPQNKGARNTARKIVARNKGRIWSKEYRSAAGARNKGPLFLALFLALSFCAPVFLAL